MKRESVFMGFNKGESERKIYKFRNAINEREERERERERESKRRRGEDQVALGL